MRVFPTVFVLGAVFSLGVALLSAVAILHADTTAWFIGGVFSYVLSVVFASLETTRVGPTA